MDRSNSRSRLDEQAKDAVSEEELIAEEREAERQELVRLLQTAKDSDRRDLIRSQISAIDAAKALAFNHNSIGSSAASAAAARATSPQIARLQAHAGVKVPLDTIAGKGRNRPVSAQRRPSFTPAFEVVPEVCLVSPLFHCYAATPTAYTNPHSSLHPTARTRRSCIGPSTGRARWSCL